MKIAGLDVYFDIGLSGTCPKCNNDLKEEDNGWFEKIYYCPKCEIFYHLKLIKMQDRNLTNKEMMNKIKEKYKLLINKGKENEYK